MISSCKTNTGEKRKSTILRSVTPKVFVSQCAKYLKHFNARSIAYLQVFIESWMEKVEQLLNIVVFLIRFIKSAANLTKLKHESL